MKRTRLIIASMVIGRLCACNYSLSCSACDKISGGRKKHGKIVSATGKVIERRIFFRYVRRALASAIAQVELFTEEITSIKV